MAFNRECSGFTGSAGVPPAVFGVSPNTLVPRRCSTLSQARIRRDCPATRQPERSGRSSAPIALPKPRSFRVPQMLVGLFISPNFSIIPRKRKMNDWQLTGRNT